MKKIKITGIRIHESVTMESEKIKIELQFDGKIRLYNLTEPQIDGLAVGFLFADDDNRKYKFINVEEVEDFGHAGEQMDDAAFQALHQLEGSTSSEMNRYINSHETRRLLIYQKDRSLMFALQYSDETATEFFEGLLAGIQLVDPTFDIDTQVEYEDNIKFTDETWAKVQRH